MKHTVATGLRDEVFRQIEEGRNLLDAGSTAEMRGPVGVDSRTMVLRRLFGGGLRQ